MKCPFCSGEIAKGVKKCKYCGEYINLLRRWNKEFFIPLIIGLIVGYLLFYISQMIDENKQRDKLMVILKIEFSQNHAIINNIEKLIQADLIDLKTGKITITPLQHFYFNAWEIATASDSEFLLKMSTGDYFKLSNCYTVLKIIDSKIAERELYRIYNEDKANFLERMEILDKNILDNIEKVKSIFKQAQDSLYRIHDWKVKGYSFDLDNGLVVSEK